MKNKSKKHFLKSPKLAVLLLVCLLSFCISVPAEAQERNKEESKSEQEENYHNHVEAKDELEKDDSVYIFLDKIPEFPGGSAGISTYIRETLKYPVKALEDTAMGRVDVKFIVEKDGSVSNVEIVKSVHPSLDEEAIRIIKMMPHWTPGEMCGKPKRVSFRIPITFRLQNDSE